MAPRNDQSSLRALEVFERCLNDAAAKPINDYDGLARAVESIWDVLNGENISLEVAKNIARLTTSVLARILDAKKAAKTNRRLKLKYDFKRARFYAARALACALCVGFGIAFFYTPRPLGSCVPLAFAVYILGVTFPLKRLLKLKRDARKS